jgi:hypothetical protein
MTNSQGGVGPLSVEEGTDHHECNADYLYDERNAAKDENRWSRPLWPGPARRTMHCALGSRVIASWSNTYGMTEELTPTPMPTASAFGFTIDSGTAHPVVGCSKTKPATANDR